MMIQDDSVIVIIYNDICRVYNVCAALFNVAMIGQIAHCREAISFCEDQRCERQVTDVR